MCQPKTDGLAFTVQALMKHERKVTVGDHRDALARSNFLVNGSALAVWKVLV
jgi:hypothetical protein